MACITSVAFMIHVQMEDETLPLWEEKFFMIVICFQEIRNLIWNGMSVTIYTSAFSFGVSYLNQENYRCELYIFAIK